LSEHHLVLDGRHIDGRANGLSRFSEELVHAISCLSGVHLTLISNRPITPRNRFLSTVGVVVDSSVAAKLPGSLWLTLRGPSILRQLGATHFLGTIHTLPLIKPTGVTYGLLMHDLVYHFYPETMTFANRWMSRLFVPKSLKIADKVFAVSETTLRDIRRLYQLVADTPLVAYPGATFPKPTSRVTDINDGPIHLLFVGSREPRKNLLSLLKAFDMAKKLGFTGQLHLVSGAQWGHDDLSELIDRHGGKSIFIHQKISDADLILLYEQSDYLVMPSIYEGLGLPILEAVGRCAVLANDIPVFRELSDHIDGIRLLRFDEHPDSLDALAHEISALTRSPASRFRGSTAEETFTWKCCAKTITSHLIA